jgi:NADH:ubiquinone reductase (H+-translocating)
MQSPDKDRLKDRWDEVRTQTGGVRGNGRPGNRPKVVVLGAGFGGLWAAQTLAKGPVDVLLIDRHNYHTFFPLLYQVGAAELEPEEIAQPLRMIFWRRPNVHFCLGEIEHIDLSAKEVSVLGVKIPYDYLVVALGSQPNFYGIPGADDYAFTLKSIDQGMALRNQILSCFERATLETDPARRQAGLTITVVGGGPTGVEFSGALMELIRGSLKRDYPDLDLSQLQVVLLEAADHLLEGMPKSLSDYAQKRLEKMGVDVHLNAQVVKLTPYEVFLKDGARIASRTVVWLAGVNGNILANQWGLATNRHNQIEILPTLQAPDHPEVYVVGDLAGIQQDGKPLPMVAQVGIQTGTSAGQNILRDLAGQPLAPFRYHDKGTLDVIGRNAAAAYIWRRAFYGFPAWLIWAGVHIFNLIGFRNRLLVLVNWAWDYIFYEHGVRLIIPSSVSASRAPAVRVSPPQSEPIQRADPPEEMGRKEVTSGKPDRSR